MILEVNKLINGSVTKEMEEIMKKTIEESPLAHLHQEPPLIQINPTKGLLI